MKSFVFILIGLACCVFGQVPCGDNSTYCPSGSTCCPLEENTRYGCCPIPDAVCCSDHLHCCPSGMTCDTAHAQCTNGKGVRLPMHKKTFSSEESSEEETDSKNEKSIKRKVGVQLTAAQRKCHNGDVCKGGDSTCCYDHTNNEAYCCPFLNGKCCAGGKKCCPKHFVCSAYGDSCIREKHGVVISMQMSNAKLADENKKNDEDLTVCPDDTKCPSKNTCCPSKDGTYTCCPLSKAKCCGSSYCCPQSYKCSSNGQCEKSESSSYDFLDSLFRD